MTVPPASMPFTFAESLWQRAVWDSHAGLERHQLRSNPQHDATTAPNRNDLRHPHCQLAARSLARRRRPRGCVAWPIRHTSAVLTRRHRRSQQRRIRSTPRRSNTKVARGAVRKNSAESKSGWTWTHTISLLAVLATVGTLAVSYNSSRTEQRKAEIAEWAQLEDRFDRAIRNLSDRNSIDVRLGGIHLLESLLRDSPRYQPVVLNQLSSFVRQYAPKSDCIDRHLVPYDVSEAVRVIGQNNIEPERSSNAYSVDLHFTCLRGINLTNLRFVRANLVGADLAGAQILGTNMSGAHLSGANLDNAVLTGVDFTCAVMAYVKLRNSWFVQVKLIGADLIATDLTGALMLGSDISYAVFTDAIVTQNQLDSADTHEDQPQRLYCIPPDQYRKFGPGVLP
jgi:Pentapeptide repeats (8 copies)